MKTDLDKLKKDIAWLINQVKCFMSVFPAATTWSTNHSATTGNKYLKDTLVWDNGFIYKCLVDNNSNPTSNSFYWEKVTKGWLLQQEQADWNATGGPSFIRNKPTSIGGGTEEDPIFVAWLDTDPLGDFLTSEEDPVFSSWLASEPLSPYYLATNPVGYITSSSLTPYLTITSASTTYFPIPTGTISQYLRGDGSLATFPTIPTSLLSNTTPDPYLGLRLQPSDTSNNGFYINKSVNQAVGYYARNTDNVGNGAVSAFYVGGTGTLYENYAGFFHANNGYFVPYLRGKNGISSNNDFFFVGYEGAGFDFRTGAGTFGGETSKFSISNAGVLQIGVQPALDNTITEILGRKSDGTIIRIDKPTVGTWGELNYPTWTAGTPFVKMTAAGTFALDTNTYLTSAVTSVGATSPLTSSGGNTPTISTSMATNKLVGRYSVGTGVMEEITIGSGLTLTGAGVLNNTAAATPVGYYGAWQDMVTQTAASSNVGYPFIFRTIDLENQVRIVSNGTNPTRITFDNTGIYNLQFSAQIQNTDNAQHDVTIWIRKNGVDVVGSAGFISVPARKSAGAGNEGHGVFGWNYLLSVVAGEYYEIVWSTTNATHITIQYYAAGSPPPSTASVLATVTQQSGIMAGTGITGLGKAGSIQTGAVQTLAVGTSGTDFDIVSSGDIQTFNLPTASATNRGALSSADWTTFNNKQNTSTLLFDSFETAINRSNYFWATPSAISNANGYGLSTNSLGQTFTSALNSAGSKGMTLFASTATAGTIAFKRRNDAWVFTNFIFKFTQKIQFQTNTSGQRFFHGLTKNNQFTAPTNVEPNTLTNIVGVCQLSTSTNMHVIHNDASGTATTIDLGIDYPCTDPQYNYYITIEQNAANYVVTVERITVLTGAKISTSNTLSTNIMVYTTGVIQICTFMTNNTTNAIASYLDGGLIGNFNN